MQLNFPAGYDFEALLLSQNAIWLFICAYLSCTIKVIFQSYLKAKGGENTQTSWAIHI